MNLGENIYRLRSSRKLSQDALAEALEVSRQSVSKWENNMAVPDLDKLIKMRDLFGITLDELVAEEPPEPVDEPASQPREDRPSFFQRHRRFLLVWGVYLAARCRGFVSNSVPDACRNQQTKHPVLILGHTGQFLLRKEIPLDADAVPKALVEAGAAVVHGLSRPGKQGLLETVDQRQVCSSHDDQHHEHHDQNGDAPFSSHTAPLSQLDASR